MQVNNLSATHCYIKIFEGQMSEFSNIFYILLDLQSLNIHKIFRNMIHDGSNLLSRMTQDWR